MVLISMDLQNGKKCFSKLPSSFLVVRLGINQRREEIVWLTMPDASWWDYINAFTPRCRDISTTLQILSDKSIPD